MIIYLDVDGVCADIHMGLSDFLGLDYRETIAAMTKGEYGGPYLPEIFDGCIWDYALEQFGEAMWVTLPDLPWFRRLWEEVNHWGEVVFLTSPALYPEAASGRMKWLQERFGHDFKSFVITPRKELLANHERCTVLIDDCDANIDAFREAGGHAIRIPQRWNHGDEGELTEDLRPQDDHVMDHVVARLKDIRDQG